MKKIAINWSQFPVTGKFGDDRKDHKHKGIDLAMEQGYEVPSPVQGEVIWTGSQADTGNMVKVRDPEGNVHKFMHLDKIDVAQGDLVDKDSPIGAAGNTGRSTGSHLHYEVRDPEDNAVDPNFFLGLNNSGQAAYPMLAMAAALPLGAMGLAKFMKRGGIEDILDETEAQSIPVENQKSFFTDLIPEYDGGRREINFKPIDSELEDINGKEIRALNNTVNRLINSDTLKDIPIEIGDSYSDPYSVSSGADGYYDQTGKFIRLLNDPEYPELDYSYSDTPGTIERNINSRNRFVTLLHELGHANDFKSNPSVASDLYTSIRDTEDELDKDFSTADNTRSGYNTFNTRSLSPSDFLEPMSYKDFNREELGKVNPDYWSPLLRSRAEYEAEKFKELNSKSKNNINIPLDGMNWDYINSFLNPSRSPISPEDPTERHATPEDFSPDNDYSNIFVNDKKVNLGENPTLRRLIDSTPDLSEEMETSYSPEQYSSEAPNTYLEPMSYKDFDRSKLEDFNPRLWHTIFNRLNKVDQAKNRGMDTPNHYIYGTDSDWYDSEGGNEIEKLDAKNRNEDLKKYQRSLTSQALHEATNK